MIQLVLLAASGLFTLSFVVVLIVLAVLLYKRLTKKPTPTPTPTPTPAPTPVPAPTVDASGNTVDASGNIIDASGNTLDASGNIVRVAGPPSKGECTYILNHKRAWGAACSEADRAAGWKALPTCFKNDVHAYKHCPPGYGPVRGDDRSYNYCPKGAAPPRTWPRVPKTRKSIASDGDTNAAANALVLDPSKGSDEEWKSHIQSDNDLYRVQFNTATGIPSSIVIQDAAKNDTDVLCRFELGDNARPPFKLVIEADGRAMVHHSSGRKEEACKRRRPTLHMGPYTLEVGNARSASLRWKGATELALQSTTLDWDDRPWDREGADGRYCPSS